jgi:predicted translin family RNA/ssDNA-binding protein
MQAREERMMTGYTLPTGEDDPVNLVRMIGRLAQMVQELRDEYVDTRRDDALDQLDRRLEELEHLHQQLRRLREEQATG